MPIKKYKCHWCFMDFEDMATYKPGGMKNGKRVHHGIGNQIQCPYCLRFIEKFPKIYIDDKGSKHIHDRS
jgi:hypothetical protein